jgi:hypothetical protein
MGSLVQGTPLVWFKYCFVEINFFFVGLFPTSLMEIVVGKDVDFAMFIS